MAAAASAEAFGLRLTPDEGADIARITEMIKAAAADQLPVVHPEQPGDADGLAQVVGVLGTHLGVGVQGVAVAVQPRNRYPRAVESGEVLVGCQRTRQQVVDRQMWCGQETAGVDLGAGQSQGSNDLQRLP